VGILKSWKYCISYLPSLKQSITNTLALPIDKMLYILSIYCVHTVNTKKIHSNLNSLNTFTKETGSPNMKLVLIRKLPKVGSNAIVLVPVGAGPNKSQPKLIHTLQFRGSPASDWSSHHAMHNLSPSFFSFFFLVYIVWTGYRFLSIERRVTCFSIQLQAGYKTFDPLTRRLWHHSRTSTL
jgi:hypothetical protein